MLFELFAILAGLVYTGVIIAYRVPIATAAGVIDHPGSQGHKAHRIPTPLVGGVACLPPAILAGALSANLDALSPDDRSSLIWMVVAVALSATVGFIDDRKHIPAPARLLVCGLVFSLTLLMHRDFVVHAISLESLRLRFLIESNVAVVFSTFCLLAFQNSVNMADGRNGLVIGLAIIWSVTLLAQGPHPTNLTMIALIIGLIITLGFNINGKLFLGDAGTYGIGALIGLVTIWVHRSGIGLNSSQVIAMFLIPMVDMARLIFLRLANSKSPFAADHNHLHHYLDREFGWNIGRIIYLFLVAIPIITAQINNDWSIIGAIVGIVLYATVVFYTRRRSSKVQTQFS